MSSAYDAIVMMWTYLLSRFADSTRPCSSPRFADFVLRHTHLMFAVVGSISSLWPLKRMIILTSFRL